MEILGGLLMKTFWILALLILSMPVVSAYSINAKTNPKLGENFNLRIQGNGAYAVELQIPVDLDIVSDPSSGARTGTMYKTFTSGETILVLRPLQVGTYRITGKYTAGSGIKDFNSITISVTQSYQSGGSGGITPSCPICPDDTKWSNCENIQQMRIVYGCSEFTDYKCAKSTESRYCTIRVDEICESGWVCKDGRNLAYQSSDCSLSSVQACSRGCVEDKCNVTAGLKKEGLTVEIIPAGEEPRQSVFAKIWGFVEKIWNILIFWK